MTEERKQELMQLLEEAMIDILSSLKTGDSFCSSWEHSPLKRSNMGLLIEFPWAVP